MSTSAQMIDPKIITGPVQAKNAQGTGFSDHRNHSAMGHENGRTCTHPEWTGIIGIHMKRYIILLILIATLLSACQANTPGWRKLNLSVSPPASAGGAVVYITSSDSAVYLGGFLEETWLWENRSWRQSHPANQPPPRAKFLMAYNETDHKVVLFGGIYDQTLYNDTWEWDGNNWTEMKPAHVPPARCCSAMAYDKTSGKILLYGGWDNRTNTFLNDLWAWDGSDWSEVHCCAMPVMSGHKMVTYSSQILSTLTSGQGTHLWDGNSWQKLDVSSPPDRPDSALVYDSHQDLVVLFGGKRNGVFLNDTWVFDGTNWFELKLRTSPSIRDAHVMFYDEQEGSIILFGGVDENGSLGDTWELDLPDHIQEFSVQP